MFFNNKILIGKNEEKELYMCTNKINRHGLITGSSGSGKTITLKVMAESFSEAGIPVFMADVKGDLAGTCISGTPNEKIDERLTKLCLQEVFEFKNSPVIFWDIYGKSGHPIRTTVTDIGPTILSKMLGLTEAQSGVLSVAFKIAQDAQLELIDLKDLRLLLQHIGDNRKEFTLSYGNISIQSIGGIQRNILILQEQGGDFFFGEPSIDITDFIRFNSETGYGNINILHAVELFKHPNLYSCFILWLLTSLNHKLPEVGDLEKPRLVFFIDEAHLLFDDMPKYMLTQITQIVKLIRSKGIGLYFISQTPNDIPDEIQTQLGNRIQHSLRAYTPAEQKIVKAVATSFRINPLINTEETIMSLGTGEALISFINENGEPNIVEKATILPPQSSMGTIDEATRNSVISNSIYKGKYDEIIDRESAFEKIMAEIKKQEELEAQQNINNHNNNTNNHIEKNTSKPKKSSAEKAFQKATNSAITSFGRKLGNELFKKLFK